MLWTDVVTVLLPASDCAVESEAASSCVACRALADPGRPPCCWLPSAPAQQLRNPRTASCSYQQPRKHRLLQTALPPTQPPPIPPKTTARPPTHLIWHPDVDLPIKAAKAAQG